MNHFQEAAEHARSMANFYRKFVSVAEVLDRAGSFEQAAEEAQNKLNSIAAQRDTAIRDMEAAREGAALARSEAQALIADANAAAAQIEAQADETAKAIIAAAETAANDTAIQIIAQAKAQQEKAEKTLAQTRSEVSDEQMRLMNLRTEINAKSQQVDSLNAALAELRSKLG